MNRSLINNLLDNEIFQQTMQNSLVIRYQYDAAQIETAYECLTADFLWMHANTSKSSPDLSLFHVKTVVWLGREGMREVPSIEFNAYSSKEHRSQLEKHLQFWSQRNLNGSQLRDFFEPKPFICLFSKHEKSLTILPASSPVLAVYHGALNVSFWEHSKLLWKVANTTSNILEMRRQATAFQLFSSRFASFVGQTHLGLVHNLYGKPT